MRFLIHSKTGCPYCTRAKTLLDQLGYPYQETLFDEDGLRQQMYDSFSLVAPYRSVPQIIQINDDDSQVYVGGYNALVSMNYPAASNKGMFDANF